MANFQPGGRHARSSAIFFRTAAVPSKLRLSTPYYLQKKDIDRYLAAFDQYKKTAA